MSVCCSWGRARSERIFAFAMLWRFLSIAQILQAACSVSPSTQNFKPSLVPWSDHSPFGENPLLQGSQSLIRLRGGGGEGVRLAIRKKKGSAFSSRKNTPHMRSKKNLSVVEQANVKITKHIHARIENVAAQRAGAAGEKLQVAIRNQRSQADRKMNLPNSQPGAKYVQRIRSLAGQNARKGGSVGKSKRRR